MQYVAGAMVTPQVRLSRPLGEGGMGSLWVADHLAMQIEVAVKFVAMDVAASDPSILERFDREASVLVQLDSPQVVKLFERGQTDDGTPFIVMELLLGETLVDRLERTGEMSPAAVAVILDQLGAGLEHFHGKAIIHRDLKAENIFLVGPVEQPVVKILDFGLARPPGAPGDKKLTGLGTLVGTAEFMSPEQIISAMDVDHSADLWALAVLAYMMLVATRPFDGDNMGAVLMAVRMGQYDPPSSLLPGLPPGIDEWFAKAFDLNHKQRFQSAREACGAWQSAIIMTAGAPAPAPAPTAGVPTGDGAAVPAVGMVSTVSAVDPAATGAGQVPVSAGGPNLVAIVGAAVALLFVVALVIVLVVAC